MFYFPSCKMIYSDSLTMFYTFMGSKTKFYRSKNDMIDIVLHLQRQMNRLERNRGRKNRNGKEAQGHQGKMAPIAVRLSTNQKPVK